MASEDTEGDLGVLDELLHEAVATGDGSGALVADTAAPAEESDAVEVSADDILQQLDSVTLLDSEEDRSVDTEELRAELNHSVDTVQESPLTEVALADATASDGDQLVGESLPPQEAEEVPSIPTEKEETIHEANMVSSEAPEESSDRLLVAKDATEEHAEVKELAATSCPLTSNGVADEGHSFIAPEAADSTASVETIETESAESVAITKDSEVGPPLSETAPAPTTETTPTQETAYAVAQEERAAVFNETIAPPLPDETPTDSRIDSSSSDGSWESVTPPPLPLSPAAAADEASAPVLPPPAPQPLFSGSLNPVDSSSTTEVDANDSDSDDSDQEDGDERGEPTLPHPPLQLNSSGGDDDDELEVDPAVAEEIRASKAATSQTPSANALLDALQQADSVAKQHTADVLQAHASKMDEIALSFDSEPPLEVRAAQVVATQAHPESSATMFGIGYQSMKKRNDSQHNGDSEREAYTMAKGPTFHELESEVTLTGDVSLALTQCQINSEVGAGDDDEFGEILSSVDGPVSPTRVDAIIQKTLASKGQEDDEQRLLNELKKATHEEKLRLKEPEVSADATTSKAAEDNALTLKELHSIYKRGFGDQEVLLMDDDNHDSKVAGSGKTTETSTPPLSVMGRILSKHAIAEEVEEDEEEEEEESTEGGGVVAERSSLDDDDAQAVTVESDRMILVDGSDGSQFAENTKRPQAEQAEDEWREIQLLREVSPTSSKAAAESASASNGSRSGVGGDSYSKISYAEAQAYFLESEDILVHLDQIVAEEKAPPTSCFGCLSRQRLTFPDAINQRDRFFCVAATPFDPRNTVHVRMLQTIYRQITNARGSNRDVPLMGVHWESIGFQGSDPTTDLRGCGVLSLLQLLHLVETQAELARSFHSLSQHAVRHFPMACASINITLQCLVAMRSGALYRESNKRASVFAAANALHVALTSQLMKEINASGDEIPIVMKRVLDHGRLHPDKALELYAVTSSSTEAQSSPRKASTTTTGTGRAGRASSSHAPAEFTEIGLHSVDDD